MPELPDVELFRRFFIRHALGRRISAVACPDSLVVGTLGRSSLDRELPRRVFGATRRHGKYLFARADWPGGRKKQKKPVWVVLHFGMTGSFVSIEAGQAAPPYSRVIFRFDDRSALVFVCPRRFGRVALVDCPEDLIASKRLGPDPLAADFGIQGLRRALSSRRGAVKAALLDQKALAGVGNLYADEALFQAGIHPRARVDALKPEQWSKLQRALLRVLRTAIERDVGWDRLPRGWLLTRRRERQSCPRCGAPLAQTVVGGRTTYFCPRHQRRPDVTR